MPAIEPSLAPSGEPTPVLRKAANRLHPMSPPRPVRALGRGIAALADPLRPMLAQLIVTRRCNLACGYCNEFDTFSPPVPADILIARIDHLAKLGTLVVTLSGGEPLLHPELDRLIARVTSHGMVCTMISNGYPLTRAWIERLNAAGLSLMQISVDNLEPNNVSQKSFSKIRDKLMLLREHAKFAVNVNAVLGSSDIAQTRELVGEIHTLGFYMTVGLLHDHEGQIDSGMIGPDLPQFYREMRRLCRKSAFHGAGEGWEDGMMATGTSPYRCRAGARYLYVEETGRVSYCSQRRGEPGIDILDYGREALRQGFDTPKGCESQCTIACVRRASAFDEWRPQKSA